MPHPPTAPAPDDPAYALVLSGGGARGAYQAGALAYMAEAVPQTRFSIYTGVSAGAINVAHLASVAEPMVRATHVLKDCWRDLAASRVFHMRPLTELIGPASTQPRPSLFDTTPLRHYLEEKLSSEGGRLMGLQRNLEAGRVRALALTTANYSSHQTVTWVQGCDIADWERPNRVGRATHLTVDHVMASAAPPLLFPAVYIDGAWYGDGGLRLLGPLAPALHLGADALFVISTRYDRSEAEVAAAFEQRYPTAAQMGGMIMNSVFLDVLEHDVATLERINALVRACQAEEARDLRAVRSFVLRPSVDIGQLASQYPLPFDGPLGWVLKRLVQRNGYRPDWLSMLTFAPAYVERLIEIGYADARAQHDEIATFFAETATA